MSQERYAWLVRLGLDGSGAVGDASRYGEELTDIFGHMVDSLPLRLFIASPSDLAVEREVVSNSVREFNARYGAANGVRFEVVGWDRVRGTARRAQEAINELIGECHYLIALFKGSWGSEPGSRWGYTSGTEEELFTALLELAQPEQPMRDVWIAFLDHPSPAREIGDLRHQLTTQHAMMYESIVDSRQLKEKLSQRLLSWQLSFGAKIPRHVELLPSSGTDVLRATNLRLQGEKLVELGQIEVGRERLKEATYLGGPVEHLAYARFLGRYGELDQAYETTQTAIDQLLTMDLHLYSPLAAEAFAAQAGLLRRQGRSLDAIGRLEQALTLLPDPRDAAASKVRCRILDELGLAHQKSGNPVQARERLEESLATRRAAGDNDSLCQSLINLARIEVGVDNLGIAADYAAEALEILRLTPPTGLHANAEALAAQVMLRQGKPEEAIPHAQRALSVNQQIANRNGEAISLLLLAQCCRAANQPEEAAGHALACLEVNRKMGNDYGVQRARWILEQLKASEAVENV